MKHIQGVEPMTFDDKMKLLFADMGMIDIDRVVTIQDDPEVEVEELEVEYA